MDTLMGNINPEEWYEKDTILFQSLNEISITPPRFDCPICFDNFSIEEMYTLDCVSAHRVCFECIKETVQRSMRDGQTPTCPSPGCGHSLGTREIAQFLDKADVEKFDKMMLRSAISSIAGNVACPTQGCENWMIVEDMTRKSRCECSACGAVFCTLCRGPYHYGTTTCQEIKEKEIQWMHWQSQFKLQRANLNKEMEKKLAERQQEVETRLRDLSADEEWKSQNCKLCPQCSRVIQRTEGCSSMKCGTDYHGGNTQNGCGASFNWDSAPAYSQKDLSHLQSLDLRDEVARQIGLGERVDHGEFTTCDVCTERIFGLRFVCLHCPCYNVCEKCEERGIEHVSRHVFDILGLPPPVPTANSGTSQPGEREKTRSFSFLSIFRKSKN